MQVGIKVLDGKISRKSTKVQDGIRPCRLEFWKLYHYEFWLKISKSNKSAGLNKGMQVGKFFNSNKVCWHYYSEVPGNAVPENFFLSFQH